MMDELELKELLKTLKYEYDEATLDIIEQCTAKEEYIEEFIAQQKIYAQIVLVQHILDSKSKASLAGKAKHN